MGALAAAVDDRNRHRAHGRLRLHGAGKAIAEYVEDLSNWYVRLSRRRFWEGDRAAFATLRHCLLETVALLAPFIPFLADEIHANLAGGEGGEFGGLPDSVHLRDFPRPILHSPTPAWRRRWLPYAARSSLAGPPAPRRRSRCASRCAER